MIETIENILDILWIKSYFCNFTGMLPVKLHTHSFINHKCYIQI